MDASLKKHWDTAYNINDYTKLGWYEEDSKPTLKLFQKSGLSKNARILNVGVGASTLIDEMVSQGFKHIIASDISSTALEILQTRLGSKKDRVQWIVDDLTQATTLSEIEQIDLWCDRAVLHFFTKEEEQNAYFSLLKTLVKNKGYVIIATFNTEGATRCSGLPVHRYDKNMLVEKLGLNFQLLEYFNFTYIMPSGDTRPYIYTLFKRSS